MTLRYGEELEPGELQGAPPGDRTTTPAPQVTVLLPPEVYETHAAEVERTNTRGAIRRTLEERARDRMSAVVGAMLAGSPEHDIPGLPADVIAQACLAAAAELKRKGRGGK